MGHRRCMRRAGGRTGFHLSGRRPGTTGQTVGRIGRVRLGIPLRRVRRHQHRRRVRVAARALGRAGFPGACHRIRRQGVSARAISGHASDGVSAGDGYIVLLLHRRQRAGGADDAARRQPVDADLPWRGTGGAALQCDGCGESGAGGFGALSRRRPGRHWHPGERHQCRADQDSGGQRHRRFPLHPALEPVKFSDAPQRHH